MNLRFTQMHIACRLRKWQVQERLQKYRLRKREKKHERII